MRTRKNSQAHENKFSCGWKSQREEKKFYYEIKKFFSQWTIVLLRDKIIYVAVEFSPLAEAGIHIIGKGRIFVSRNSPRTLLCGGRAALQRPSQLFLAHMQITNLTSICCHPLYGWFNFAIRNTHAFSSYWKRHSPHFKKRFRMCGYSHRTWVKLHLR